MYFFFSVAFASQFCGKTNCAFLGESDEDKANQQQKDEADQVNQ